MLLGFFLLGTDQQEIENDNHQDHGNKHSHWAALRLGALRQQNHLCVVVAHLGSQQKGGNCSERLVDCKRFLGVFCVIPLTFVLGQAWPILAVY
jgi:hypothetical protein